MRRESKSDILFSPFNACIKNKGVKVSNNMSNKPIKVALLGAGGRGRAVLKNWIETTDCIVTAVVDPSQEALEVTRDKLGGAISNAEFTTDLNGWYERADADIVTIHSWDTYHAENAIDCFNAGLAVHVSKPMAQTTALADDIVRAWRASGKLGVVDMQVRTSVVITKAKELIDGGAIGDVKLITCMEYVGRSGAMFRRTKTRTRDMVRSLTLQKGCHALDMCNLFADSAPVRVFATGGLTVFGGDKPNDLLCSKCNERETCQFNGAHNTIGGIPYPNPNAPCVFAREIDVEDHVIASLDYGNGVKASYVECYFTPEYHVMFDVIGDRGALTVRYAMDNNLWIELRPRDGKSTTRIPCYSKGGAHGGGDRTIILAIANAIRNGEPVHPDIMDGRHTIATGEAIQKSVDTGLPVEIAPPE